MIKIENVSTHELAIACKRFDLISDEQLYQWEINHDNPVDEFITDRRASRTVAISELIDTALLVARFLCEEILNDSLPPLEGARLIWRVANQCPVSKVVDLHPFIYAASEAEDRTEDHEFFNDAVISEAKRFLEKPYRKIVDE